MPVPNGSRSGSEYLPDGVSLAVEDFVAADDGPAPARAIKASGGGYGLTGMRERAELLGGTLNRRGLLDMVFALSFGYLA